MDYEPKQHVRLKTDMNETQIDVMIEAVTERLAVAKGAERRNWLAALGHLEDLRDFPPAKEEPGEKLSRLKSLIAEANSKI